MAKKQESRQFFFFLLGVSLTVSLILLYAYTGDDKPDSSQNQAAQQGLATTLGTMQQVQMPPLPDSLDLGGEPVPLDYWETRERLDKELLSVCFYHSSTLTNLKLANRYFPIIEPILAKHGIPDDLKYLAVAESNLQNLVSPAGAKGIWQFMPETAKEYGMGVSKDIDERYDVYASTEAACKYLKGAYKQYQSWSLAAASYNMGKGALNKNMEAQGESSYYKLYLNPETSRYVFRILAYKLVLSNPERYGFLVNKELLYPQIEGLRQVQVKDAVLDWMAIAKREGISYRQLRIHNPWIRSSKASNPKGKVYTLLIEN